ncbi:pro-resilin-like [Leptopilina heterotoma]|uniref:pro-resilin-like n=1 Tax=Leptopilina heterotoma TaxID=63436 RepID=UPI001CA9B676|nr:pro-resilin-like [Leptopilina heterotoma]
MQKMTTRSSGAFTTIEPPTSNATSLSTSTLSGIEGDSVDDVEEKTLQKLPASKENSDHSNSQVMGEEEIIVEEEIDMNGHRWRRTAEKYHIPSSNRFRGPRPSTSQTQNDSFRNAKFGRSYGVPTPGYGAGHYPAPGYGAGHYPAPGYGAGHYPAPGYGAGHYPAPGYGAGHYPPPGYSAGHYPPVYPPFPYFPGQQGYTPGFNPQWGKFPQTEVYPPTGMPLQFGNSQHSIASLLALQQSAMLANMQESVLKNANSQAETYAKPESQTTGKHQALNPKKIHRDVNKLLRNVLQKHGVVDKKGARGKGSYNRGRGRGGGKSRGGREGGWNRNGRGGSGGGQGLSI